MANISTHAPCPGNEEREKHLPRGSPGEDPFRVVAFRGIPSPTWTGMGTSPAEGEEVGGPLFSQLAMTEVTHGRESKLAGSDGDISG